MEDKTIVVFRKFRDGAILALFPAEKYNDDRCSCMSYQHTGQHSEADYGHCMSVTKAASPGEYDSLKNELERLGYDLKVMKRYSRK